MLTGVAQLDELLSTSEPTALPMRHKDSQRVLKKTTKNWVNNAQ